MSGCVAFAKHKGSAQVESELLPQIWEQVCLDSLLAFFSLLQYIPISTD